MEAPLIFNIQKFSLHDGPGIRTTVFFKGCPLTCLWCHNPEGQSFAPQTLDGKPAGQSYTVESLVSILAQDVIFYDQTGGGVTLSGGEVMAQNTHYLVPLCAAIKEQGIHLAIDTSGHCSWEKFEAILPFADLFLYDIKHMDTALHRRFTGVGNEIILENLTSLAAAKAEIIIRIMLAEGVNDNIDFIKDAARFLAQKGINPQSVSLLPYHDFGRNKYEKLGRPCTQNFSPPSPDFLQEAKFLLESSGFKTHIHA